VLSKAKNLKYAIFSDLFVSRLRAELPESLLYLMDNIMDKNIIQLDLSHNAFGPDGVKSFQKFLSATKTLEILDVSNCGLGPRGG
jgi:Ran GTPase-activating protein 1